MNTIRRRGSVQLATSVPAAIVESVERVADAEHRSRSSAVAVLLTEALDARARAAEAAQGGESDPPRGGDTGQHGSDAQSASQGAETAR